MNRSQIQRRERYLLREGLREFTRVERQEDCGTSTVDSPVILLRKGMDGWTASLRSVSMCTRLTCPVCAPVMWSRVAWDLTLGIGAWQAAGNSVALVELRMLVCDRDSFESRWQAVHAGWSEVRGNRKQQRRRMQVLGLVGYHARPELVHQLRFGWQPRLRALMFLAGTDHVEGRFAKRLEAAIQPAWSHGVIAAGQRVPPPRSRVDIEVIGTHRNAGAEAVARYLASGAPTGIEPSGGPPRTLWQVLSDACNHHRPAQVAWQGLERELQVRGRRLRSPSQHLHQRLGLTAKSEPVADPLEQRVAVLDPADWYDRPRRLGLGHHATEMLELVEDAKRGGFDPFDRLASWLQSRGAHPPQRPSQHPAKDHYRG